MPRPRHHTTGDRPYARLGSAYTAWGREATARRRDRASARRDTRCDRGARGLERRCGRLRLAHTGCRDRRRARRCTSRRACSLPLSTTGPWSAPAVQWPLADVRSVGFCARSHVRSHHPPLLGAGTARAQRCPRRVRSRAAEGLERAGPKCPRGLCDDRARARLLKQSVAPGERPLRGPRVRAVPEGLGVAMARGEHGPPCAAQFQHLLLVSGRARSASARRSSPACRFGRC